MWKEGSKVDLLLNLITDEKMFSLHLLTGFLKLGRTSQWGVKNVFAPVLLCKPGKFQACMKTACIGLAVIVHQFVSLIIAPWAALLCQTLRIFPLSCKVPCG